jgi:hypothetical protein
MELIWGIVTRGIGAIYLIAFAQLLPQVIALAGAEGAMPVADVLKAIRRDFPSFRRVFYFPTLLWFSPRDAALKGILLTGCVASLVVIAGGPLSPLALLVCAVCFLSMNAALDLPKPWDCLLHESGFLAIFLPPLHWLPSLSSTAPAPLLLAWAYRYLLFRLMFGFAKYKFHGSTWADRDYLRGFYISQPMPTYIGWYMQRLPMAFHYVCLAVMAVTELIVPFLMFFPGRLSLIAAIATAGLMLGIQATGNYGYFNVLTIVLCVSLLDPRAFQLDVSNLPVLIVAVVVFVGGLIYFPFNSWVTHTCMNWPSLTQIRAFGVRHLLAVYRCLAPFRIVHAYGVFPPNTPPPGRWIPVIEGTADGKTWKEYEYRHMTCRPSSPPSFHAPFEPRFDYTLIYEAYGANTHNFFATLGGNGNPYRFTRQSLLRCVVQRLLEGNKTVKRFFKEDPFPDHPPLEIRVSLMLLTPADDGNWWVRRYAGPHFAPVRLQPDFWHEWLPHPEIFHPDEVAWRKRAKRPALDQKELREFREVFLPFIQALDHFDWKALSTTVARVRERFEVRKLRQFERTMGRLATDLSDSSEKASSISFFHHVLLAYYVVGQGEEALRKASVDPTYLSTLSKSVTPQEGLFYLSLFWHDTLEFHAKKIRLLQKLVQPNTPPPAPPKGIPGFVELLPFITEQFEVPEDALVPKAIRVASGEWRFV